MFFHTACADSEALATTRMAADSQNGSSESLATKTEGSFERRKPKKTKPKRGVSALHFSANPYLAPTTHYKVRLFLSFSFGEITITSASGSRQVKQRKTMTSSRTSNASPSLQLPDLCDSYDKEGCKQASKLLVSTDFDNFLSL